MMTHMLFGPPNASCGTRTFTFDGDDEWLPAKDFGADQLIELGSISLGGERSCHLVVTINNVNIHAQETRLNTTERGRLAHLYGHMTTSSSISARTLHYDDYSHATNNAAPTQRHQYKTECDADHHVTTSWSNNHHTQQRQKIKKTRKKKRNRSINVRC